MTAETYPTATPRLALPLMQAAQAQKHVTHNEALAALDALVHLRLQSRTLTDPPTDPQPGDVYQVAGPAGGLWAGQEGRLAIWGAGGGWSFADTVPGMVAWVVEEAALLVHDGAGWTPVGTGELANLPRVGVNTTASDSQRLSVKSDEVVLSHDDVTPGTGDCTATLNKALAGDDAGLAFKTGWAARALVGLYGDDDFTLKVSPGGAAWHVAMVAERASGRVSFPSGLAGAREMLSADRTYYVDAAVGDDTQSGLGPGAAFATIQRAVDAVATIDMAGHTAIISVAPGTYAESVSLKNLVGGPCVIVGNEAAPATVTVAPPSSGAFLAIGILGTWRIRGLRIASPTAAYGLYATSGVLYFRNLDFGQIDTLVWNRHLYASGTAVLEADGNYTISGGTGTHWLVDGKGAINVVGRTITLAGTPDFSTRFAQAGGFGELKIVNCTFSGSATGARYYGGQKGLISVNGAGPNYFPGTDVGTLIQDSIYV